MKLTLYPAIGETVLDKHGNAFPIAGMTVTVERYYQELMDRGELLAEDPYVSGQNPIPELYAPAQVGVLRSALATLVGLRDGQVVTTIGNAVAGDENSRNYRWNSATELWVLVNSALTGVESLESLLVDQLSDAAGSLAGEQKAVVGSIAPSDGAMPLWRWDGGSASPVSFTCKSDPGNTGRWKTNAISESVTASMSNILTSSSAAGCLLQADQSANVEAFFNLTAGRRGSEITLLAPGYEGQIFIRLTDTVYVTNGSLGLGGRRVRGCGGDNRSFPRVTFVWDGPSDRYAFSFRCLESAFENFGMICAPGKTPKGWIEFSNINPTTGLADGEHLCADNRFTNIQAAGEVAEAVIRTHPSATGNCDGMRFHHVQFANWGAGDCIRIEPGAQPLNWYFEDWSQFVNARTSGTNRMQGTLYNAVGPSCSAYFNGASLNNIETFYRGIAHTVEFNQCQAEFWKKIRYQPSTSGANSRFTVRTCRFPTDALAEQTANFAASDKKFVQSYNVESIVLDGSAFEAGIHDQTTSMEYKCLMSANGCTFTHKDVFAPLAHGTGDAQLARGTWARGCSAWAADASSQPMDDLHGPVNPDFCVDLPAGTGAAIVPFTTAEPNANYAVTMSAQVLSGSPAAADVTFDVKSGSQTRSGFELERKGTTGVVRANVKLSLVQPASSTTQQGEGSFDATSNRSVAKTVGSTGGFVMAVSFYLRDTTPTGVQTLIDGGFRTDASGRGYAITLGDGGPYLAVRLGFPTYTPYYFVASDLLAGMAGKTVMAGISYNGAGAWKCRIGGVNVVPGGSTGLNLTAAGTVLRAGNCLDTAADKNPLTDAAYLMGHAIAHVAGGVSDAYLDAYCSAAEAAGNVIVFPALTGLTNIWAGRFGVAVVDDLVGTSDITTVGGTDSTKVVLRPGWFHP